jgi:hypothetical protein
MNVKPEPRFCLDLPAVGSQALNRSRHAAAEVRGGLQAMGLDGLTLQPEYRDPARHGVSRGRDSAVHTVSEDTDYCIWLIMRMPVRYETP